MNSVDKAADARCVSRGADGEMQQSRISSNQVIALPVLRVSTPYLEPFQ